uniref:C3H1-type domain-containing protein n=1 Tax=Leucosporidium scottii TaxID=5278 RepID=A0A0H5FRS3_9BASI|nr:hypothetical protein [Leucosporidium scottii]
MVAAPETQAAHAVNAAATSPAPATGKQLVNGASKNGDETEQQGAQAAGARAASGAETGGHSVEAAAGETSEVNTEASQGRSRSRWYEGPKGAFSKSIFPPYLRAGVNDLTAVDATAPSTSPADADVNLPPRDVARNIPCRFFPLGACKYGDQCVFSHGIPGVAGSPGVPSTAELHPAPEQQMPQHPEQQFMHHPEAYGQGMPMYYPPMEHEYGYQPAFSPQQGYYPFPPPFGHYQQHFQPGPMAPQYYQQPPPPHQAPPMMTDSPAPAASPSPVPSEAVQSPSSPEGATTAPAAARRPGPSMAGLPFPGRGKPRYPVGTPKPPCSFFESNRCRNRDGCPFQHLLPDGTDARHLGQNWAGVDGRTENLEERGGLPPAWLANPRYPKNGFKNVGQLNYNGGFMVREPRPRNRFEEEQQRLRMEAQAQAQVAQPQQQAGEAAPTEGAVEGEKPAAPLAHPLPAPPHARGQSEPRQPFNNGAIAGRLPPGGAPQLVAAINGLTRRIPPASTPNANGAAPSAATPAAAAQQAQQSQRVLIPPPVKAAPSATEGAESKETASSSNKEAPAKKEGNKKGKGAKRAPSSAAPAVKASA